MAEPPWYLWASLGGLWAGPLAVLYIFLHGKAKTARDRLEGQIAALSAETKSDHTSVRAQLQDMANSVSANYVRRPDFDGAIVGFHKAVDEARKEIGLVHNRLDDLYKSVEFRRRTRDG